MRTLAFACVRWEQGRDVILQVLTGSLWLLSRTVHEEAAAISGRDDGGWTLVAEGSGDTGLILDFEGQVTEPHRVTSGASQKEESQGRFQSFWPEQLEE